jgi:site-specific DNA recombinase
VDQFSLPMQALKIADYCREHLDATLLDSAIFREEGFSGRPGTLKKRPGLRAALEACREGTYTHLVVHKLDRLGRNVGLVSSVLEEREELGIVFVSVQDRVDASTAAGRLYIAIFIAIAQWYSDNLSEETKKGKEGRKRAGLYNGILPFGAMRGEGPHAVPLPDLRPLTLVGIDGLTRERSTHAGLLQAFAWCAQGDSAREIAVKLNEVGYRTAGTHGSHPFTKDTVQKMLGNRFYLGELPDGQNGWVPGKHSPLIPQELWDQAQQGRARHRLNPQTIPSGARVHVLGGGLLRCGVCWLEGRSSAMHVSKSRKAEDTAYFTCYGRGQGAPCTQPSVPDVVLEAQLAAFFASFRLPEDYQERVVALYQQAQDAVPAGNPDPAARRTQLEARLERQQQLYELGDWTRERYLQARQEVLTELAELERMQPTRAAGFDADALTRLGTYVREVTAAWQDADKANKRLLVRTLFERLWVLDDQLVAAQPVAQFAPFFQVLRDAGDTRPLKRIYRGPALIWMSDEGEAEVAEIGRAAQEIAQDVVHPGRLSQQVQTSGPDGIRTRGLRRDRPAC